MYILLLCETIYERSNANVKSVVFGFRSQLLLGSRVHSLSACPELLPIDLSDAGTVAELRALIQRSKSFFIWFGKNIIRYYTIYSFPLTLKFILPIYVVLIQIEWFKLLPMIFSHFLHDIRIMSFSTETPSSILLSELVKELKIKSRSFESPFCLHDVADWCGDDLDADIFYFYWHFRIPRNSNGYGRRGVGRSNRIHGFKRTRASMDLVQKWRRRTGVCW